VVVRVRDVQLAVRIVDPARLVELRLVAVREALFARAEEGHALASLRVDAFDLVVIGVRHVQVAIVSHRDAQRVLEPHIVAGPVHVAEVEQASADNRPDLAVRVEISGADRARFRIGEIQQAPIRIDAAGLVHARLAQLAIGQRLAARSRVGPYFAAGNVVDP